MGKNKISCDPENKKEDESRWLCFTKSSIKAICITTIFCIMGLAYIYYRELFTVINNDKKHLNPFSTDIEDYFPSSYYSSTSNTQLGGNGKCKSTTNRNIILTTFPYNLPKKKFEYTFNEWFANTIYEASSLNNKILDGFLKGLANLGNNKFIDIIYLLFGWFFTLLFFVFSFLLNMVTPIIALYNSFDKFDKNLAWKIPIGILSIIFGYPIILMIFFIIYYPFKMLYSLTLKPFIDNTEEIINISKCNSTIIAYLLTLLIVIFGWNHLSLTVASIMTFMWLLLFIKDIYNYLNISFTL